MRIAPRRAVFGASTGLAGMLSMTALFAPTLAPVVGASAMPLESTLLVTSGVAALLALRARGSLGTRQKH